VEGDHDQVPFLSLSILFLPPPLLPGSTTPPSFDHIEVWPSTQNFPFLCKVSSFPFPYGITWAADSPPFLHFFLFISPRRGCFPPFAPEMTHCRLRPLGFPFSFFFRFGESKTLAPCLISPPPFPLRLSQWCRTVFFPQILFFFFLSFFCRESIDRPPPLLLFPSID